MRHPPRPVGARLLGWRTLLASMAQGLAALIAAGALYFAVLAHGADENTARAQAFTVILLSNLGLILANRSQHRSLLRALRTPNRAFWWVTVFALVGLALTLYQPTLAALFRFAPLDTAELALAVATALLGLLAYSGARRLFHA